MIVRDTPSRTDLLFAVRGSIVPVIAPRVAFLTAMSALMVALHRQLGFFPAIDGSGFTSFGIALSLFLGFRNNAAYDRWWEARKLWGGLLADTRSVAREAEIFVRDKERRLAILRLTLAFLHLHRSNLRGLDDDPVARSLSPDLTAAPDPPCAALDRLSGEIDRRKADVRTCPGSRIARKGDRASGGGGNDFVRPGASPDGQNGGAPPSLTRDAAGHHAGPSVSQDPSNLSGTNWSIGHGQKAFSYTRFAMAGPSHGEPRARGLEGTKHAPQEQRG